MASSGIDFSKLTPDNGAVRDLRQLLFLAYASEKSVGDIVNVLPAQYNGDKVGFIGEFGPIGKASTGCDPTYGNDLISTSEKTWDIKEYAIAESICYKDLESSLLKYALKEGIAAHDLTGSEYLDGIVAPRLERAIKRAVLRFAFFGDKAASAYTSSNTSGTLAQGVDAGLFTLIDGYWKQLFTAVSGGKVTRVTIDANTKATPAAQKTAAKAAGVASGIVDDIITSGSAALRQQEGQRIYMTQALADALTIDVRNNNKGSELQWQELHDGMTIAKYGGVEIVAMPWWDEIISSMLNNSTTHAALDKPYRAIYTVKENLLLGTPSGDGIAEFEVSFNSKDRKNYIYAADSIGALVAQEDLVVVAY